jgi:hypothetical protein
LRQKGPPNAPRPLVDRSIDHDSSVFAKSATWAVVSRERIFSSDTAQTKQTLFLEIIITMASSSSSSSSRGAEPSWADLGTRVFTTLSSGLAQYQSSRAGWSAQYSAPVPSAPPFEAGEERISEDPAEVAQVLRNRQQQQQPPSDNNNPYFNSYAAAEGLDRRPVSANTCACGQSFAQPRELAEHVQRCPKAIVPCEFAAFGCRA